MTVCLIRSLLLASSVVVGCRSKHAEHADVLALDASAALPALEVDATFATELAQRTDCRSLTALVASPVGTPIDAAAQRVLSSRNPYFAMRDVFSAHNAESKLCTSSRAKSDTGLEALQGAGPLSVIIFSGLAQIGPNQPLSHYAARVAKSHPNIRFVNVPCSVSVVKEDECVKAASEASRREMDAGRKVLLWGYSSGALTALSMLAQDQAIRDATIGAVIVSGLLGGSALSAVADMADTVLKAEGIVVEGGSPLGSDTVRPLVQAMFGAYFAGSELPGLASAGGDVVQKLESLAPAIELLHPTRRLPQLRSLLAGKTFARSNGTPIPASFLVSILDLGELENMPALSLTKGELKAHGNDAQRNFIAATSFSFRDFPLSDGVAGLEHQLLPNDLAVSGLKTSLAGVLQRDHIGMSLGQEGVDESIIDAVFAVMARNL